MRDAAAYFKGIFQGYPSPIQNACQSNYVILITDGLQTDTMSSTAVQVQAGIARRQDHSTTIPGTQYLITHTIGFDFHGYFAPLIESHRDAYDCTADRNPGPPP